ncbi:3-isopropylmalate dehydratase large subunit [Pseudooceanicola nanhaiensis]|uniref:3-isopropylmalate dehydratase large subunit n=1 Tax=Pseudooceanicola nanhaiensis TaxID=375761 RepID=UPI001CD5B931|nr:3-isopropylmalate dehydratase large subunit [Pseudooceanicola nanhaiensis]MCA0921295.1 3-isopropylmalate dehydratase large subunit [Pseudooceanicola nanhaiensis]
MTPPRTLVEKIWAQHVIGAPQEGRDLLHVDRHLLHDLAGVISLEEMEARDLHVLRPDLTPAILDHTVSTLPGRGPVTTRISERYVPTMERLCAQEGIPLFRLMGRGQGIAHVVGPEQGLILPGLLVVCGDSHTTTHGALGALAWGIGSTEVTHVLATQTLYQAPQKQHLYRLTGHLRPGVGAKDVILWLIGRYGTAAGAGAAVEFAGPVISDMGIEDRMVLCNMTLEMGAKVAIIAPDQKTLDYLEGRPFTPTGAQWEAAKADWATLYSDPDAAFDLVREVDCSQIAPQVTWGTTPELVGAIDAPIPDPEAEADPARQRLMRAALDYMGLMPGQVPGDLPVDWVFIGSCAGGRIEDLRNAAAVVRGRHVAEGLTAWVVPGSTEVRLQAEAEGLDRVFTEAGFEWRQSGCSLCSAANGETVPPGARCVSTSNRNFVGRQGPGARTHIASPVIAAASALAGHIAAPLEAGA